jgi:transcriptional regulator with XRE-family HTH domain
MTMTGKELKQERTELKITQSCMSELSGIKVPLLSAIERSNKTLAPDDERKVRKALREFKRLKSKAA